MVTAAYGGEGGGGGVGLGEGDCSTVTGLEGEIVLAKLRQAKYKHPCLFSSQTKGGDKRDRLKHLGFS